MELTPKDLGTERYFSILNRRFSTMQTLATGRYYSSNGSPIPVVSNTGKTTKAPKRLTKYWTKDLNLSEAEAERIGDQVWQGPYGTTIRAFFFVFATHMILPILFTVVGAPLAVTFFLWFFFPLLWGSIIAGMTYTPRQQLKTAHERAVSTDEVENLLPHARGRLERLYLHLVLDTLRTPLPSVSAQNDIKAALRHLGDAISRLPAEPVAVQDADALRREAMGLRQQAAYESDSFVAASLQRQVDTLEKRATLAAQNGRSARRVAALRREARSQIDALRAVLIGFQQTPLQDTAHVSQLSAALHRVSTEAQSAALAQQELDNEELERLFGAPLPPVTAQTPAPKPQPVQQAQQAQTPSVQPAQPQPAPGSGHWWRNNSGA